MLCFYHTFMQYILAGVVELADTQDLGSCGQPVQVQVLSPAAFNHIADTAKPLQIECLQGFLFYRLR